MAQQYIRVIYHRDKMIDQLNALDIDANVRDKLINETDDFLKFANGKYNNPDPNKNLACYLEQIKLILVKSAIEESNLSNYKNGFINGLSFAILAAMMIALAVVLVGAIASSPIIIMVAMLLTIEATIASISVLCIQVFFGSDEKSASFDNKIENKSKIYSNYLTFFNKEGMTIESVESVDAPLSMSL